MSPLLFDFLNIYIYLYFSASYDSIYRSEVIDSSVDLHPSLAASFFYPAGLDVNIKVTLWYSSSLTRNKVIVLGYSINNLLQLMNGDANKTMVQHLISEYPLAAKSCLQILPSFPPVFVDKYLAPLAPSYRSNPLQQSYVFYCDSESAGDEPVVVVDEFAWEPRLSMKVSLLYLESCLNALLVSHKAWVGRRQAEMTRLGVFESPEIAFQCGWQQISIRIPSAMLTVSRHRVRRESISASMASAMSTAKYSYLLPASSSGNGASLLSFPSDLSVAAIESSYIERLNTLVASRDRIRQTANFGRVDESLPCTYIDIYIEDRYNGYSFVALFDLIISYFLYREQTFSSFVGRTNVELHTLHPVYGSNINSHSATV